MTVTGMCLKYKLPYRYDPEEFLQWAPVTDSQGQPHNDFLKGPTFVVNHPECFRGDDFSAVNLVLDHDREEVVSVAAGNLEIISRPDGLYFRASIPPKFRRIFRTKVTGTSAQVESSLSTWGKLENHRALIFLQAKFLHIGCALYPDQPRGGEAHRIHIQGTHEKVRTA
jgi:hypothetical protein